MHGIQRGALPTQNPAVRTAGAIAGHLPKPAADGDNQLMRGERENVGTGGRWNESMFSPGAIVVTTLCNPREKFWGMILALAPEGLSLGGAELASFEDLATMVKDGEPFTPAVVFFPMHRIERIELDLPDGGLPSLSQRFLAKTGLEPSVALAPPGDREKSEPQSAKASKERK
jgi:hypothetical protein